MSSKLGSSNGGGDAPAAPIAPPSPGVSKLVKLSLLIVLCLQNAVYTMLRRYRCEKERHKYKIEHANDKCPGPASHHTSAFVYSSTSGLTYRAPFHT